MAKQLIKKAQQGLKNNYDFKKELLGVRDAIGSYPEEAWQEEKIRKKLQEDYKRKVESRTYSFKQDNRTSTEREIMKEYMDAVDKPNFQTLIYKPLYYGGNPISLLGDITNKLFPKAPINDLLPNNAKEERNDRLVFLNPYLPNDEKREYNKNKVSKLTLDAIKNAA